MLALHTQHLPLAWLSTFVTLDDHLLWGPVGFLRMGHYRREQRDVFNNSCNRTWLKVNGENKIKKKEASHPTAKFF